MAGLLNIVPRYLPRYGMAPDWTRAMRPLVIVFTIIAFTITVIFKADVNAQGGAYATGVLVLMSSAAVAVAVSALRRQQRAWAAASGIIAVVFVYTTVVNIIERPDGIKIARFFIGLIILISLLSRISRTTELRVKSVEIDQTTKRFLMRRRVKGRFASLPILPQRAIRKSIGEKSQRIAKLTTCHSETLSSFSK